MQLNDHEHKWLSFSPLLYCRWFCYNLAIWSSSQKLCFRGLSKPPLLFCKDISWGLCNLVRPSKESSERFYRIKTRTSMIAKSLTCATCAIHPPYVPSGEVGERPKETHFVPVRAISLHAYGAHSVEFQRNPNSTGSVKWRGACLSSCDLLYGLN